MSAETPEQMTAGGDDLRARYLPVSRKELRRRRETELALQREAQEAADAVADELADAPEDQEVEQPGEAVPEDAAAPVEAEDDAAVEAAAEDELTRLVDDVESSETPAQGEDDQETLDAEDELEGAQVEFEDEEPGESGFPDDDSDEDAEVATDAEDTAEAGSEDEPAGAEEVDLVDEVPEAPLPEPVDQDGPERPEEEIADAVVVDETPEVDVETETVVDVDVETEHAALDTEAEAELVADTGELELPAEDSAEEEAPVPASRRARRLLRETESIPKLDEQTLAELDQLTAEIAKQDDPDKIDPELLKKQQAVAAKAMQANQRRLLREQEEAQREARRRRRRERPESELIAGKMVRDVLEADDENYVEFTTGSIEPVHAQGAHGLDLDKMVDATSRQADRQNMLLWLVIVLSVLLVIAVAAVVYFIIL